MTVTTPHSKELHEDHRNYVETYRAGNPKPFGEAYLKAWGNFPTRFPALGLKETDGMDLFQKAVESMLINFSRPDFTLTCPLEAYLSSIFVNLVRDFWRKKAQAPVRISEIPDLPVTNEPDAMILAEESEQRTRWYRLLNRTFAQLETRCRNILMLTKKKVAAADIAEELNITNANAVYQARVRCRDSWERFILKDADYAACKPEKW